MEQENASDLQTSLDLSCRSRQETNSESEGESESQNCPALDLSCKNPVTPTTIRGTNRRTCLFRRSPAHTNKQDQRSNLSEVKKQSPFTSNIILSSSSESDSPKGTEFGQSFYNTDSNITNNIPLFVPPPAITMGMPFLPIPPYLNNEAIKIPVATSLITSTTTSCETSLQTNRTTEKTPLEFMNGPLTQVETSTLSLDVAKKIPRPFKAYSKNPFPALKRQIDPTFTYNSSEYIEFREKMLTYKKINEGAPNPKMRRTSKSENPGLPTSTAEEEKDAAYWERRKKNNEAAKRSRDARRAKEDELAIWATFLEKENTRLNSEVTGLYNLLQQLGYNINQIKRYNKLW